MFSRRSFLLSMQAPTVRREVFRASPKPGVAVMAFAWYTKATGGEMMSIEQHWTRSDTIDKAFYRFSNNNGRNWSEPVERATGEKTPRGMLRRHLRGGWVDPKSGRFVEIWNEGVLPGDDPLEGLKQWNIFWRVNRNDPGRPVVHKGAEYNAAHPLPGIWIGKNSVMLGDSGYNVITMIDGSFLLPVTYAPLDAEGKLYNPTGGYTFHDAAVLTGRWKGDDIEWEMSAPIKADPAKSTRGWDEPTIARLDRQHLMMVLRGSNDKKPTLPSHKWVSFSQDNGRRWTPPQAWTYDDGEAFFSPSACSQLLAHSNGRLYWLGNITPENPRGNRPRYPFVIGEVDRGTGRLKRSTVRVVDTKQENDDPILTLSNFYAREDRETNEIVIHMTRLFAFDKGWQGDAFAYRVTV